jgi:hypothetical protein
MQCGTVVRVKSQRKEEELVVAKCESSFKGKENTHESSATQRTGQQQKTLHMPSISQVTQAFDRASPD